MNSAADAMLVLVLLLNFFVLGSSRIRSIIYTVAAQGVLLGILPVLVHGELGVRETIVSVGAIALKAVFIPRMLMRAMADLPIRREIEPLVGFRLSLLLGAAGTGISLALAARLPTAGTTGAQLLVPASFATILTGFIVLTTRVKAITQVLGYLVLENGIFIFGLLLLKAMPFLVEVGVLLDLFVAIFVMGIMINHISREFSSISTERLSALKE
ncbi:Hydrogenase-4 component E [Phycisphaerales bacterium]|nr:Hydrogenase-4 component E [Phycisphaerales bacterium]